MSLSKHTSSQYQIVDESEKNNLYACRIWLCLLPYDQPQYMAQSHIQQV